MGDAEKDLRQKTKHAKLGPGKLGACMETHQPPPPLASLLYTVAKQCGEAVLRGGIMAL
jgi:hypothetical protein